MNSTEYKSCTCIGPGKTCHTTIIANFIIIYNELFWISCLRDSSYFYNIFFCPWSLGCWTLSLWVALPTWLSWTKSTPTVLIPAWPSRTSRPKSPHIPSYKTWLVPTPLPASPPARRLCSISIPPAPIPVTAWVWVDHRCSTPSCLACTAAWSPCPSRWACPPVLGLSKLRCMRRKRGVQEPGEPEVGHPST